MTAEDMLTDGAQLLLAQEHSRVAHIKLWWFELHSSPDDAVIVCRCSFLKHCICSCVNVGLAHCPTGLHSSFLSCAFQFLQAAFPS